MIIYKLYKKYYMNGVDPTTRIGSNGPIPNTQHSLGKEG